MMDKIRMSISNKLKQYRKNRGLTQEQFAEQNNISVKTIAQWEQGKAEVPMYIILMLRDELGQSIDQIYGLEVTIDNLDCEELEKFLNADYPTDKVAAIDYIDIDYDYKVMMRADMSSFFAMYTSKDISVDNVNKKVVFNNIAKYDKQIIRYLIAKGLIVYRMLFPEPDKDGVTYDEPWIEYYLDKRIARIMLSNAVESLTIAIEKLSKDSRGYERRLEMLNAELFDANKMLNAVKKFA